MLGLLQMAIFGLIVGAVAKLVMPGKDPGGILVTMGIGVAGAVIGGFAGRMLGLYGPGDGAGFIVATLTAVVLLYVYRRSKTRAA